MRILQLISTIGYYGAESVVSSLARQLQADGHESIICVLTHLARHDDSIVVKARKTGIPALDIPCSGRLDRQALAALRQFIREHDIDVIHSHNYKSNLYAYLATRGTSIPRVATCHNWTKTTSILRLYAALDRVVLRAFTKIVAVSAVVRESLRRAYIPDARTCIINNGVEVEVFRSAIPAFPRQEERQVTVGAVCRLVYEKGVHDLLYAAEAILRDYPNIRFLIAGDGPNRLDFENLTTKLGISSQVTFLGFREDMPAIYASFDIFVLPSHNEGLPMSVLEAMAAGRPVIANRVGALPQVVNGTVGSLIDVGDRQALYRSIRHLLDNPNFIESQGRNARQLVCQSFGIEETTRQYVQIYDQAIHSRLGKTPRPIAGRPVTKGAP